MAGLFQDSETDDEEEEDYGGDHTQKQGLEKSKVDQKSL